MREILFRAKNEAWRWIAGSLVKAEGYCCILRENAVNDYDYPYLDNLTGCIDGYIDPVDPETICQYTGIDDKNGVKIFEGDIVRFRGYYQEPHWIGTVTYDERNALYLFVGVMPYRNDSRYESKFEVQISSKDKDTFEVLGNKWDNPELLGEEAYSK